MTAHAATTGRLLPMTATECMRLLTTAQVGRVAINDADGPLVAPVNFRVHEGIIVFRADEGAKLAAARDVRMASFQVDDVRPHAHAGWSVLVRGTMSEVRDPSRRAVLDALGLVPWAAGPREHWIEIVPARVTGQRVEVPESLADDPAALGLGNIWYGADGDDLLG